MVEENDDATPELTEADVENFEALENLFEAYLDRAYDLDHGGLSADLAMTRFVADLNTVLRSHFEDEDTEDFVLTHHELKDRGQKVLEVLSELKKKL